MKITALLLFRIFRIFGCTSLLFGGSATIHDFPVTTHANDCAECDGRMIYVPAKKYSKLKNDGLNERRQIFDGANMSFPRSTDSSRSQMYASSTHGESQVNGKSPIGEIEQVESTFGLYEASYPIMNEFGLAFGESTTGANPLLNNKSKIEGGQCMMAMATLMAIALERCKSARCAIELMGRLATKYGFYGESPDSGESVSIIDEKEAWIFEITGDGDSSGALWVAQKIPKNHVAVLANAMIIGEVDFTDHKNFMWSPNLKERTCTLKLWGCEGPFNWKQAMSNNPKGQSVYSFLRTWRIFEIVTGNTGKFKVPKNPRDFLEFPTSVKVSRKFTIEEIMNLHRDHFQGSQFDMTQGIMAGPFGNPNHEMSLLEIKETPGFIPRPISLMRTSYSHVSTSGPIPKIWFAPDAPATSVFVPFYAQSTQSSERYGNKEGPSLQKFERFSAYWAFDFVANWMNLNYRNMSKEFVFPYRDELQSWVIKEGQKIDEDLYDDVTNVSGLNSAQIRLQDIVATKWWEFADFLIVRYNDGFFNLPDKTVSLPLPVWWLRMIGFDDSFIKPEDHWVTKANKKAYTAAVNGVSLVPEQTENEGFKKGLFMFWTVALTAAFYLGYLLGSFEPKNRRKEVPPVKDEGYTSLLVQ
jgi:dipeptidase